MPLDIGPAIWAAIITGAATFFVTILVAFYGPRVRERARRNKLRKGLYRELVNWYESIRWYLKFYDARCEARLFEQSSFDINPAHPSGSQRPKTGYSILQSEEEPHVGRPGRRDLQFKIEKLHEDFDRLSKELLASSLYLQTLQNEDLLQLLYQIRESFPICILYEDFRYAFSYKFEPYDAIPDSRYLTGVEAKELSLLEERLDWLKLACASFDEAEEKRDLDACLLDRLRRGKPRGTLVYTTGEPPETARWCAHCETYSEPMKRKYVRWLRAFSVSYDFYFQFLRKTKYSSSRSRAWFAEKAERFCVHDVGHWLLCHEHCKYCRQKLLTFEELGEQLCDASNREQVETAANILAKNFRFNKDEFKKDALLRPILHALKNRDNGPGVRIAAAKILRYASRHKLLGGLSKSEVTEVELGLNRVLQDINEEPSILAAAMEAVGELRKNKSADGTLEPLVWALNGTNDRMREAAAKAIRCIGDEKLFSAVYDSVRRTQDASAQKAIVKALGRFGKQAVPHLINVLNDQSITIEARQEAAHGLGNVGDVSEAWEPLILVKDDPSSDLNLRHGHWKR
jgi:hypothetical protein